MLLELKITKVKKNTQKIMSRRTDMWKNVALVVGLIAFAAISLGVRAWY